MMKLDTKMHLVEDAQVTGDLVTEQPIEVGTGMYKNLTALSDIYDVIQGETHTPVGDLFSLLQHWC